MAALKKLYSVLLAINIFVGKWVGWLAMLMVIVQFGVVMFRYIFGYSSIFAQESIIYFHAMLFMFGAGYTFIQDGHVRVDIFYQSMGEKAKAKVNIFGVLFLLYPFLICLVIVTIPYAAQSWAVLEGSRETSGIPAVFLLKSSLYVFCAVLFTHGLALIIKNILILRGDPFEQADAIETEHAPHG